MVKIAILGAGIVAECHYLGLQRTNAQIVAVASADRAQAGNARQRYGARCYAEYRELLKAEKGRVDALIIALPNFMHLEACTAAIEEGYRSILCEKPLTTSAADSQKIVELAEKHRVFFQTAYMKRFNPGFQRVKEALSSIGTPAFVTSNIYFSGQEPGDAPPREPKHWYGDLKKSGGGCLTHNGSHHIDLMRFLFGELQSVRARMRYEPHTGAEYSVRAVLEMESGVEVDMRIGRVDVPNLGPDFTVFRDGWNEVVEVVGTRGFIRCENPTWQGYEALRVKQWRQHAPGPETFHLECNEQWVNEMRAFVEGVETRTYSPAASTAVDGYRTDAIIEAMHASARKGGQPVALVYAH